MIGKFAISLAALASAAAALDPISVKGQNFVSADGKRFDMVGVAYQPGGSAGFNPGSGIDPLSDGKTCLRDAALMQKLGVNTIRVYNLDPAVSHDECAGIFDAAGIYMVVDVNSPLQGQSIDAAAPWTTYTKDYLTRVFQVIEAFKGYPNLIGFFAGNEVINDDNSGKIDPPYIRAVTRDMKNYIAKQSPDRAIPVGYSAADVRDILVDTSNYLQCSIEGEQGDASRIDFFGLNSYSWCGDSSIQAAGYDQLVSDFKSSDIPVFFSEYGCNAVTPRPFTEVAAIYGPQMNGVFSGGLVYEWTQEANNFGLVKIASDGSAQLLKDYDTLQTQFGKIGSTTINGSAPISSSSSGPQKCDASLITGSQGFASNFTLPAVPAGVQDLIDNGVQTGFAGGKSVKAPTSTQCPVAVTGSDNKPITGLGINIVSTPGSLSSGSSSSGSNSTAPFSNSTASPFSNSTASTTGNSFLQPNGTDNCNGTAAGSASGSTTTLSTAAIAAGSAPTATPPAPSAAVGGGVPGSYGGSTGSAGSAASAAPPAGSGAASKTSSANVAAASSAAGPRVGVSVVSVLAAVAGLLVL